MPTVSCSTFAASLFRGSPLPRPTLSTANASATKKSPSESNGSPTNWFASPKPSAASAHFSVLRFSASRLVSYPQHNLAARVTRLYLLMRLGSIRQWESLRHDWGDFVRLDQLRQLIEHVCIGMRHHSGTANCAFLAFGRIRVARNRNDRAAFLHHAVRRRECICTNTVQNNIDILYHVLELRRRVIDGLIDAKLLQHILVRS